MGCTLRGLVTSKKEKLWMVSGYLLGASKKPVGHSVDQNLVQTLFIECLGGINDTHFLISSAGSDRWQKYKICQKGREADFRRMCETNGPLLQNPTFRHLCGARVIASKAPITRSGQFTQHPTQSRHIENCGIRGLAVGVV